MPITPMSNLAHARISLLFTACLLVVVAARFMQRHYITALCSDIGPCGPWRHGSFSIRPTRTTTFPSRRSVPFQRASPPGQLHCNPLYVVLFGTNIISRPRRFKHGIQEPKTLGLVDQLGLHDQAALPQKSGAGNRDGSSNLSKPALLAVACNFGARPRWVQPVGATR